MTDLASRSCEPCRGDVPPLSRVQAESLASELHDWKVVDGHHLAAEFRVKDFAAALDLANRFGAVAEEQDHHPDLHVAWGRLGVTIWTHKIDGLTEADFVLAAKFEVLAHTSAGESS